MARLSAASLDSLAEVLGQANPLYAECRSILNFLSDEDGIVSVPAPTDSTTAPEMRFSQ